ncbi:unnamed protein product [Lampetra planeri]
MNAHVDDDDNNDVAESPASSTGYDLVHAAVLPKPSLLSGGVNLALQALSDIIHPATKMPEIVLPLLLWWFRVVVSCGEDPIVEWDENDVLMSAVIASLFLHHLFLCYDGRFEDLFFIATAFNQLQWHTCIRQTASIGAKQASQLQKLGELANSSAYRQRLLWAHDNPLSDKANKLNAKVCRIMSMVGSTVPFSPFEREATRPKLAAMRLWYGIGSDFLMGSPSEFEDLFVLRLAIMRDTCQWNNANCPLNRTGFTRADLPDDFFSNAGARMAVTRPHPAVGTMSFASHMRILLDDVARCPMAAHTRVSRDYLQWERGAYLNIAAVSGVIEPHKGGWLHRRLNTYSSVLTPSLLTRLAAAPTDVQIVIGNILDSTACTHLAPAVREWYNGIVAQDGNVARPCTANLNVLDAMAHYGEFVAMGQRKSALSQHHKHGFSCEKPPKGLYMCRLCMAHGVHAEHTCPLMIAMHKRLEHKDNQRAILVGLPVDQATLDVIDGPYDPLRSQLIRPHHFGPIVWEMRRPATDAMLVESNLITTNLVGCHNNSSFTSGQDAGEAVEEYKAAFMTKEGVPLCQANAVLLSGPEDIAQHPSVADDTAMAHGTGKHLASKTVNAFTGGHQWSIPLMVHATSEVQTETFRYVFPHAAVAYVDRKLDRTIDEDGENDDPPAPDVDPPVDDDQFVDKALDALVFTVDPDDKGEGSVGGATAYKLPSGDVVFMSQADRMTTAGLTMPNTRRVISTSPRVMLTVATMRSTSRLD